MFRIRGALPPPPPHISPYNMEVDDAEVWRHGLINHLRSQSANFPDCLVTDNCLCVIWIYIWVIHGCCWNVGRNSRVSNKAWAFFLDKLIWHLEKASYTYNYINFWKDEMHQWDNYKSLERSINVCSSAWLMVLSFVSHILRLNQEVGLAQYISFNTEKK